MKITYSFQELANIIAEKNNIKDGNYSIKISNDDRDENSKYTFEFLLNTDSEEVKE